MKCEPYEKHADRYRRLWKQTAAAIDVNYLTLIDIYIKYYCVGIHTGDFHNLITKKSDTKFVQQVKERCDAIPLTENEIKVKEEQLDEFLDFQEDSNILNYRLKQLIEVGDEVYCDETKTYCFSGVQYVTKGKRYKILSLSDDGGSGFGYKTTTDLDGEVNYGSVYGCRSLWRDGKEIWNWNRAYLDLFMEQNPGHEQTQDMIEHTEKEIKKYFEV